MALQVVEIYDSFRPYFLLGIEFRIRKPNENGFVRTFRSSYYSIREIYDGALTRLTQQEFSLNDKRVEIDGLMLLDLDHQDEQKFKQVQLEEEGMYFERKELQKLP